jgi:hypothetical protein
MTDAPPPRTRASRASNASRGTANPAPRPALPRVKPLGSGGGLPDAPAPVAPTGPAAPTAAGPGSPPPATGRDLLIPNGSEQARRKGRGSTTVPTLAELMPPAEQRHGKKPHGHGAGHSAGHSTGHSAAQSTPPTPDLTQHGGHKAKAGKGKAAPEEPVKEVELAVTLSKGLRKRLKAKAAEIGLSPEAAVAQLVEVWVDG